MAIPLAWFHWISGIGLAPCALCGMAYIAFAHELLPEHRLQLRHIPAEARARLTLDASHSLGIEIAVDFTGGFDTEYFTADVATGLSREESEEGTQIDGVAVVILHYLQQSGVRILAGDGLHIAEHLVVLHSVRGGSTLRAVGIHCIVIPPFLRLYSLHNSHIETEHRCFLILSR